MRNKAIFKAQMGKDHTANSQQVRAEPPVRVSSLESLVLRALQLPP